MVDATPLQLYYGVPLTAGEFCVQVDDVAEAGLELGEREELEAELRRHVRAAPGPGPLCHDKSVLEHAGN